MKNLVAFVVGLYLGGLYVKNVAETKVSKYTFWR
jgi:hypothetical protein